MSDDKTIPQYRPEENDLSLREVILKIREYWAEIRRNWIIILFFVSISVSFFAYKAFTKKTTYEAKLTFMMNAERGSSLSALASMLGGFGDLLGAGSGNGYQFETILEIAQSRRIISQVLFDSISIDKKKDLIANHLISKHEFHKRWKKDTILQNFTFKHGNIDALSIQDNKALLKIYDFIVGSSEEKAILFSDINKKSGIMSLKIRTHSEYLSVEILKKIYYYMNVFYVQKSTKVQKETFDILSSKRDSIGALLGRFEYEGLRLKEQARGLVKNTDAIGSVRSQRQNQLLLIAFGEAIKNTELAEFTLKNQTPLISLLDEPIYPLKPLPKAVLRSAVVSLIISFIAVVLVILTSLKVKKALYEDSK